MAYKKWFISALMMLLFAVVLFKNLMRFPPFRYSVFAAAFVSLCLTGYVLVQSVRHSEARQPDVTAISHPNIVTPESLDLPEILDEDDRAYYREAFAAQREGEWERADKALSHVSNKVLLGDVMAERFLSEGYYSRFQELSVWLRDYNDHPQVKAIESLRRIKKPASQKTSTVATSSRPSLRGYGDSNGLAGSIFANYRNKFSWNSRDEAKRVWQNVFYNVSEGKVSKAWALLKQPHTKDLLRPREFDVALWGVASGFYAYGKNQDGYDAAAEAASRSGGKIPEMHWVAGMAAWRLNDIKTAGRHFSAMAKGKELSPWERSAAAYWAYRSYTKLKQPKEAAPFLEVAAKHPRTFYGILARYELDESLELVKNPLDISGDEQRKLLAIPAVKRMIALAEVEEYDVLEQELRFAFPALPRGLRSKLVSIATSFKTPAPLLRMGKVLEQQQNVRYDFATYPIPGWKPEGGYDIEPALVFALIRQESGFNASAKSHAGARGLMQIMPDTAKYVQKTYKLEQKPAEALFDPDYNLTLGQHYLRHLMGATAIDGNLFFLVSAYNAGPGNLNRWIKEVDYKDDPLLFIESIPSRETRNYIEQVMANYWIYRNLLGKDTPSLDSLASGGWPAYNGTASQVAFLDAHVNIFDY